MCSLALLLTISLQLVASYSMCLLPSLLVFTSFLRNTFAVFRNYVKEMSENFKDPVIVGLAVRYFFFEDSKMAV